MKLSQIKAIYPLTASHFAKANLEYFSTAELRTLEQNLTIKLLKDKAMSEITTGLYKGAKLIEKHNAVTGKTTYSLQTSHTIKTGHMPV